MTAIDTNLLVYAHRSDSPLHRPAAALVQRLAEGRTAWAIPWPCVYEFLAIVTHPRIYAPPTSLAGAVGQVEEWLRSPSLTLLTEPEGHWAAVRKTLTDAGVSGPRVHDARVASLCEAHGVVELLSADRDFGRFGGLRTQNPLVGPAGGAS